MIKSITITHGYSDSNKGDLAITQATVDALSRRFPKASITLMSTFRESDPDFWHHNRKMKENDLSIIQGIMPTPYTGGNSSFLTNILAVIRLVMDYFFTMISITFPFIGRIVGGKHYKAIEVLKKSDLVVVKGGQFIYNDKEDLRGNIFLWRTLQPIKIALKLQKRVVILGQSIGGFASAKSEKYAITQLSLCEKILVREQLSRNLLAKYELKNTKIIPDMAFNININKSEEPFDINKEILGITVVNWSFPNSKNVEQSKQEYVDNLLFGIKMACKELNLFPVFIPQVTVKHHGKSDLDLIKIITNKLEESKLNYKIITKDYNASEMVYLYSKCKLLIGTRLHSCILAAVAKTPVIAIRYQGYKTQGVMKMLGSSKYAHDIYNLNGQELLSIYFEIIANHQSTKNNS